MEAPPSNAPVPDVPPPPHVGNGGEDDRVLLEGPHSRSRELLLLFRAVRDFIRGFRGLHFVGPCVTVFGSARFPEGHQYYVLGQEVGRALAQLGFTVMTGGGPGVMEAANRGAQEAGGCSVGCNITLAHEQSPNRYLDRYVTCHYFFVRKVLLFKYSVRLRLSAGRVWHAGRVDRSAHADPDRQDPAVSGRVDGRRSTGSRLPSC